MKNLRKRNVKENSSFELCVACELAVVSTKGIGHQRNVSARNSRTSGCTLALPVVEWLSIHAKKNHIKNRILRNSWIVPS